MTQIAHQTGATLHIYQHPGPAARRVILRDTRNERGFAPPQCVGAGRGTGRAMFLHGLWNGLTGLGLPGIILAYGLLACVLVVLITVIVADRRRILGLLRRYLPAYQDSGLVTEADLRMLCTLRERWQARRWARRTGGRPLARAMAAYQLAATELALAHQRAHRGGATPGEFEERRRALIGVMGPAHQVIWGQGRGVAGPARHIRPGGR